MKSLHIIGLVLVCMVCYSTGFSQNQNQSQVQPQAKPQTTSHAQAQPQTPNQPQTQPQTPSHIQAQSPANQSQSPANQNQTNQNQRRVPPRQRAEEAAAAANGTSGLTERAKIKNEEASKAPAHVVWLREMYRSIDLNKESNAALYYPVQPIGDRVNLFTTLFKLMADGKITAYNYLVGGQEVFTDEQKVNFEDILKKYQVLYQKQGTGDNIHYIVDNNDIPSSEVLEYRIKEGWYFDAATGTYKSHVIAICPMLVQKDYNIGDTTRNALFWIPYENLRPYLSRTMIMTSNYNNVMTYSVDDFFSKGMYQGDIIKTVNLKDQSLAQQVGDDPERLKLAQDSIENQLKAFKEQLWVQDDTTKVVTAKSVKKGSSKAEGSKTTSNKAENNKAASAKKEKEEKPKAVKSSTPSTPTKSVRRTR